MYTVSNVAFVGAVASNVSTGYLTFRVDWNPAQAYAPYGMKVFGVCQQGGHAGTMCSQVGIDKAAGWATYQTAQLRFTNTFLELLKAGNETVYWSRYGFFLQTALSRPDVGLVEGHLEQSVMVDPVGVQLYVDMPYFGNLWEARSYLGFSFANGSPVVPADATNIYCDDQEEERNLLNAPGTETNPLYNPLEAIQLASQVSRYYGHPVTVRVAGGEYEDTKFIHTMAAGGDVTVVKVGDGRPKVWVNEDADTSRLYLGQGVVANVESYQDIRLSMPVYQHENLPSTTKLTLRDLDLTSVVFHGRAHTFDAQRCAFALCQFSLHVTHNWVHLDNEASACRYDVGTGFTVVPRWAHGGVLSRIDPTFVSTKFGWHLGTITVPDEPTCRAWYGDTAITAAKLLGLAFGSALPMAKAQNPSGQKWARTGQFVDLSPIDTRFASIHEATYQNPATGNWTSYDTVYRTQRNTFRDNTVIRRLDAGIGRQIFTNNVVSSNYVRELVGKRELRVNNNTTDYHLRVHRWGVSDFQPDAGYYGSRSSAVAQYDEWEPGWAFYLNYGAWPTEVFEAQNNVVGTTTLCWENALGFSYTKNDVWQVLYWELRRMQLNPELMPPVRTTRFGVIHTPTLSRSYEAAFDPSAFYDTIGLRPLPGSAYINAGNPAVGYNDLDGSRNDQGHLGGPDAASATMARVYWIDSFVPVNFTKVYHGMSVNLRGDRSTWSAARTPSFTWAATLNGALWSPTGGWQNNGTFNGRNQNGVVLDGGVGTYVFTLSVNDGAGGVSSATATFYVSPARVFGVDPDKAFAGNVLPFDRVALDKVNWTFHDDPAYSWVVGGATASLPYDGVASNSVTLNWAAQRTFSAPAINERYYLKIRLAKEALDARINGTLAFSVYVVDGTGALLFADTAVIPGSHLITKDNRDWSVAYGVASAYFHVNTNTDLTVYVVTHNAPYGLGACTSWVDYVYLALADKEVDGIYQDLRLAIRHAKPGDQVQVAGSITGRRVDVPVRVAGKAVAFHITGGWDAMSWNGTQYTVRDWLTHKTMLNYMRFAYYQRQRDWAFNAISLNLYTYFDSELSGFHVINDWPDKPNSWAFDAIRANLVQHAPTVIRDIRIEGVNRAGTLIAYSDSLLQINNGLTVNNIDVVDCMQGLRITTEHIDLTVLGCDFTRVPSGSIIVASRRSATVRRRVRLTGNTFTDCNVREALATSALNRDDRIPRRMASLVDTRHAALNPYVWNYNPFWSEARDPKRAPIAINVDNYRDEFSDVEIDGNTWTAPTGLEPQYDIAFDYTIPDSQVRIHGNTSTAGKDFIGVLRGGTRAQFYNPEWPHFHAAGFLNAANAACDWTQFVTATDAASWLLANAPAHLAIWNNTLAGMRSILRLDGGSGVNERSSGNGPSPVLVRGNMTTGVRHALDFTPLSAVTVQAWADFQASKDGSFPWFNIQDNGTASEKHLAWQFLAENPEVTALLHQRMFLYGLIPAQVLPGFRTTPH